MEEVRNTMQYQTLGSTGIKVSKIGFGTGTSHFSGVNQHALMAVSELSRLLLCAYEMGINFWDTASSYGTYPHIRSALEIIKRDNIIISSKTNKTNYREVVAEIEDSLRFLQTTYIDIFLLHGVRNTFDFRIRKGAIQALLDAKERGLIRAIGFSSHGIGAVEASQYIKEFDIVMARLNFSGDYMDSYQENMISNLMTIPILNKIVRAFIPKAIAPSISKLVEPPKPSSSLQTKIKDILYKLHELGKGLIGIKLFGAGNLKNDVQRVFSFAKTLAFVDSFVIGMIREKEIIENVSLFSRRI